MSTPWPVHTLVFDLDDTLFAERDYVLGGFRAADKWLEAEHGLRGLFEEAVTLFDQGLRGTIFDRALPRIGGTANGAVIAGLVHAYRSYCPALVLCPDAAEILSWAEGRFRLALVTDGYADVQQRKIESLGLEKRIGCRVLTDVLGRRFWKPSAEGFNRVMAELPGCRDGFVYVADNPRKDFIAPRELGWRTARIRRSGGEHAHHGATTAESAECELSALTELRGLLIPSSAP